MTEPITLKELNKTPAIKLFSWPKYDEKKAVGKVETLRNLGVTTITLKGPQQQGKLRFLGKGHVGIVVEALYKGKKAALKIRRTDADRQTLIPESKHLRLANTASVGPELYASSEDMIVMELINGKFFPDWLKTLTIKEKDTMRNVLRELFEKTRRLDSIGLDHGELGKIKRHVIMKEFKPRIIDFESASTKRRPSNITSISQFLFLNLHNRKKINEIHPLPDRDRLIQSLKEYKTERSEANYHNLLKTLNI